MTEATPQDIKPARGNPNWKKKGKPSWKPASLNEFYDKEPGYTYRMIRKDPDNLAKKEAEGWEKVSSIQGKDAKQVDPGRIEHGKPMTTVQEGKDWVLARIPDETAQERNDYFRNITDRRTQALTAHIKKEVGKAGGEVHGNITISSRKGTEVLD